MRPSTRRASVDSVDPPREKRSTGVRPRVILIGLDGADWSILDRLAGNGVMPNLARLLREGRTLRLQSFLPILSPVVWTTIATGASPDVHGVLDFREVEPASGDAVPISGRSRRVPAIWNIASADGLRVGVVGWWATHPAEEVNGFFVSDHASSILYEDEPKDAMTFPPALANGVLSIVGSESKVDPTDLAPYFSMSAEELLEARSRAGGLENPVLAMERILAATRTVQRIARELYDRERPELMVAYFEGTDAIGHVFAPYIAPRLACVSEQDFRRYSGTVDVYFAMVDRLLGQWMRRAEEDGATLVLCSDHGFKWDEDRTCNRGSLNWATAGFWHRLDGILALWGNRVKASKERGEASVYDVAPTVSALLGLGIDSRIRGTALVSAFEGVRPSPKRKTVDIEVRRLAEAPPPPGKRSEYAEKLRALGYLTGSETKAFPVESSGPFPGRTEGAWNNLGLYQREEGLLGDAERSFQQSLRLKPDYASPMFNLAVLERRRGRWGPALEWLFKSLGAGHAEPEETILQWVSAALQARRRPEAVRVLEEGVKRYPASEKLAIALARLHMDEKDCEGARSALSGVAEKGGRDSLNILGLSEMCLGHGEEARRYLERSLALDPAQPTIHEALRLLGTASGAR